MREDASRDEQVRGVGIAVPAPGRLPRGQHAPALAGLIAVAGSTLALCAGSAAAGRPASARTASGSATALLNLAFADARARGSFHQALSQLVGKVRGSLTDDVTLTSGRQTIVSSDGTRAEVEVVGQTAYVAGNAHALRSFFKFSAAQVAVIGSNWVAIPSSNSAFGAIAYDVTVPTALTEVAPSGHLTEGRERTLDGQRVIPISGGPPAAFAGGSGGRATIDVTASRDPLPVRATLEVTQPDHSKLIQTGTMGQWGERLTVTPPAGRLLTASQIRRLVSRLSGLVIPGHPGYFAAQGQQGHPLPYGRPWGQACKPVRFAVDRSVPGWVERQIGAVVSAARKQGIDVTLAGARPGSGSLYYRGGQTPSSTARVEIVATGTTPSTTRSRLPMQLTAGTRLDADGHNDDLTALTAALSLPVIGGRSATVRRSVRQLIAWTQGISETTDPVSGIARRGFTDRFTAADVAAMLSMSGCARAPSTVIGIAA